MRGTFKTPHGLGHLRVLDLSYNKITSLHLGVFDGLASLRTLYVVLHTIYNNGCGTKWELTVFSISVCWMAIRYNMWTMERSVTFGSWRRCELSYCGRVSIYSFSLSHHLDGKPTK